MKQFIVFVAIFPFMMAFILQFTLQQNLDCRLELIDNEVYEAKEAARIEGGFSQERINSLKNSLAGISGCTADEVSIQVSDGVKYRTGKFDSRELITCRVCVPAGKIVAFPEIFGITDAQNRAVYVKECSFSSERLR